MSDKEVAAPMVQVRFLIKRVTLEDQANGVLAQRMQIGPADPATGIAPHAMFRTVPQLQYRCKQRVYLNGAPVIEWTPWEDAIFVREGEDEAAYKQA